MATVDVPGGPVRRTTVSGPTLRLERRLLGDGVGRLCGIDEVGRGAPAGPAFVGAVVVDDRRVRALPGVRDSKLLSPARREAMVPAIRSWAAASAVGSATADEIDRFGINVGLRLAALRALAQLPGPPDLVLLDGSHDWLSPPVGADPLEMLLAHLSGHRPPVPVMTRVRADRTCTSVAAASVLAKVARDAVMVGLARAHPGYGWEENKGYGTAAHLEALRRLGPSPEHRVSWNLAVTG